MVAGRQLELLWLSLACSEQGEANTLVIRSARLPHSLTAAAAGAVTCCHSQLAAAWPTVADSSVLHSCSKHKVDAAGYFAALRSAISSTLTQADGPAAVLESGVACLQQFLQINLCG
jgi:hypothetical protein